MADDQDVEFEDALSWLPAHILREACGDIDHKDQHNHRSRHFDRLNRIDASESLPLQPFEELTTGRKHQSRAKYYGNNIHRATGGPGMQAVFLEPGTKPCGTGVFLPRRAGTDLRPTKKPACSPVLLPYRVVQALNINMRSLSLQVSPREDRKLNQRCRVGHSSYNKNEKDFKDKFDGITPNKKCSPEILLPKEWSY